MSLNTNYIWTLYQGSSLAYVLPTGLATIPPNSRFNSNIFWKFDNFCHFYQIYLTSINNFFDFFL